MNFYAIRENAILPKRATKNSAGYDLFSNETVTIKPNEVKLIKTGIAYENLPKDIVGLLALRSSVALKRGLMLANGTGILDADFTQEVMVMVRNMNPFLCTIEEGEKIAQIVFTKYITLKEEEQPTKERISGFGSTGER
jgi:dUTP pyrophosphatase